jgi:hypothetical protein
LWWDESFDRLLRDEKELWQKWEYISYNPIKRGLAMRDGEYEFYWDEYMNDEGRRLQTGATV